MATSYPNPLTLDIAKFRAAFPVFANTTTYPDALLNLQWEIATAYVSDVNCGALRDGARLSALWLALAHLLWLGTLVSRGQGGTGAKTGATIDKVSVQYQAPSAGSDWAWWWLQTPYGQQLLALLGAAGAGGFYAGGLPETTALRKWGGVF